MPITTTTAGTYDALLSTTLAKYAEKNLEDAIFDDLVFFYVLMGKHQKNLQADRPSARPGNARKRTLTGGESIVTPILYAANDTADSYSGWDTLRVTPQDGITISIIVARRSNTPMKHRVNSVKPSFVRQYRAKPSIYRGKV